MNKKVNPQNQDAALKASTDMSIMPILGGVKERIFLSPNDPRATEDSESLKEYFKSIDDTEERAVIESNGEGCITLNGLKLCDTYGISLYRDRIEVIANGKHSPGGSEFCGNAKFKIRIGNSSTTKEELAMTKYGKEDYEAPSIVLLRGKIVKGEVKHEGRKFSKDDTATLVYSAANSHYDLSFASETPSSSAVDSVFVTLVCMIQEIAQNTLKGGQE